MLPIMIIEPETFNENKTLSEMQVSPKDLFGAVILLTVRLDKRRKSIVLIDKHQTCHTL